MFENPTITVLMPVYNCELYIKEAVLSILNQTYTSLEFLIIDDASTDKTISIINKIKDSRIKLIKKPENTGYTNSLNYGLSIAKGKYIARMDADDISNQMRFAKQVAFLEKNPNVVVCGANYKIIGSNKIKILPETHEDIKIELLKNNCFGHPTVMIRKGILDQYNLKYDIEKEPAEDYALWVTMLNYGNLHNLQEVLLHYRVHNDQVSIKRKKEQLKSKLSSRIRLFQYLEINSKKTEINVLKKVISDQPLNFNELYNFINFKKYLLKLNIKSIFFKLMDFEEYLNDLERSSIIKYFLKRNQFAPKIYIQYLKTKAHSNYKLPLKTDIIILGKSLLFYRVKTNIYE